MKTAQRTFEKKTGYTFRRKKYLETALIHPSYRHENNQMTLDNQRLEFLGDAALNIVTAAHLYKKFPDWQEGELTRMRSNLTSRIALASIATTLDLGHHLLLGKGELLSGGTNRASNLADGLEAIIGAAFLDGGLPAVEKIFKKHFLPQLDANMLDFRMDNPKGALQEWVQRHQQVSPHYRVIKEEGPPHAKVYSVEVVVSGTVQGMGKGPNKRAAEIEAARAALQAIALEK